MMHKPFSSIFLITCMLLSSMFTPGMGRPRTVFAAGELACFPTSGTATMSGTVTDASAMPIQYVQVNAYTLDGRRATGASTNAAGAYQLKDLVAGSYLLEFLPQGGSSMREWYNDQPTGQTATAVTVAAGGAVSNLNVQLAQGGQFSGSVRGANGSPLQSAQVTVYDMQQHYVASAYTNALGQYITQPGLASGSYKLQFSYYTDYVSSFYNNKASFETADALEITAANIRSGIDATLSLGGIITGKVVDATNNTALANISISAAGPGYGYGYSDATGAYTITGLLSGSYEVQARPSSVKTNLVAPTQNVTVTDSVTTPNITFRMAPGASLTGRITGPGGMALKDISVYVGQRNGPYGGYFYTDASGVYTATAMPSGEYQVYFRTQHYIEEMYNNKLLESDENPDPIFVTAPQTVTGIDAELALGAVVKGKVTDAQDGSPIQSVFVEVLDSQGQRTAYDHTDANGLYETPPVIPPGNYTIRFNTDDDNPSCAYVTEYHNDKQSKESADRFAITGAETILVDAGLSRGSYMSGKLSDADTGAALTRGGARIYDSAGTFMTFGRLSQLGVWRSERALASGSYFIQFYDDGDGYIDEYYDNKATLSTATAVMLTAPTDRVNIDAALNKGAFIAGTVKAADTGQPFSYGDVIIYNLHGEQIADTWIKDDGSYLVNDGIAPGDYLVAVMPYNESDLESATRRIAQAASDSRFPGYALTYYGSTLNPASATKISVTNADPISSIDISVLRGIWLPGIRR